MKIENIVDAHYRQFEEIKVSPDGMNAIIVMGNIDMPHHEYAYDLRNRSLWKCSLDQSEQEIALALPEEDAHLPCWSNDCSRIAYVSRQSNRPEIWLMNQDGTEKKQLTDSIYPAINPYNDTNIVWSKSDKYLFYTVVPNGNRYEILTKMQDHHMTQTHSIEVESHKPSHTTHANIKAAKNLFESSLCRINVDTGEVVKLATEKKKFIKIVGWLTEDSLIIHIGKSIISVNPDTGDQSPIFTSDKPLNSIKICGQKLCTARLKQNKIEVGHISEQSHIINHVVEIPGFDSVIHDWSQDGTKLYVSSRHGLSNYLYCIYTESGKIERLTQPYHVVYSGYEQTALAQSVPNDTVIFPYSSPTKPLELWKYKSSKLQQVSTFNQRFGKGDIPEVRIIRYPSDGWMIEAMLVLPLNYDSNKKYPMLVYVHGGPEVSLHATFTEVINARGESAAHYLANHGYAVLMPNFRGGDGYGDLFQREIGGTNLMKIPYRDVMAGVQYVIYEDIADPNRLGIYGTSFGAQLTAWTIGQTTQFKGAVGSVGVHYDVLMLDRYNGQSYLTWEETRQGDIRDEDMWLHPEKFRALSPIEHIGSVQTPMMLIETSCERQDGWSMARPFFNGLQALGVETYLTYYPKAYHNGGWNDSYKKDYMQRLVAWFDHCIKGVPLPEWFEKGQ